MVDEITVSFTCGKCGPTRLEVEDENDTSSKVFCKTCGGMFRQTWGQIRQGANDEAKHAIIEEIKNVLK